MKWPKAWHTVRVWALQTYYTTKFQEKLVKQLTKAKAMTQLNDQTTNDIFEALTLNMKLSQDLLSLLGEETEALQAMNTQELLEVSKRKSTLLSKIQFLDESLQNYAMDNRTTPEPVIKPRRGGYGNAIVSEKFKLSDLIQLLPPEKIEAANQCKKKLGKIRQDILVKNYINKKFTHDTLSCLGEAIALFTQPAAKRNTYTPSSMPPQRSSSLPQILSTEA